MPANLASLSRPTSERRLKKPNRESLGVLRTRYWVTHVMVPCETVSTLPVPDWGLVEDGGDDGQILFGRGPTAPCVGTKRMIDDAIFQCGWASNLSSVHRDFEEVGLAYDLAQIDRPLDQSEADGPHRQRSGDRRYRTNTIRSIRQIRV